VEFSWVHSALQPPISLLCQPWVLMMMEKLVEWWLAGETEVLGENLPQCRFVHHKPHVLCPDANPGCYGGKPATNRLSYGTALLMSWKNMHAFFHFTTYRTKAIPGLPPSVSTFLIFTLSSILFSYYCCVNLFFPSRILFTHRMKGR
jgi:hypothetical protein